MEKKDFGFVYNSTGYTINYKGIDIGGDGGKGAGILPDRDPKVAAVKLAEIEMKAKKDIANILAGNPIKRYAKAIKLVDAELEIGGWTGDVEFNDCGQDFLKWKIKNGQVVESIPFQTWMWKGTIVKNKEIYKGDILLVTLPHGDRTTIIYPVKKAKLTK